MSSQIQRRELLRIGGLSICAAASSNTFGAPAATWKPNSDRSCIFIMLQGGLSQLDTWDPKPDAVPEIRGPFQHIQTATPGLNFGELLPKSAAISECLTVIRSMTHKFTNHIAGT